MYYVFVNKVNKMVSYALSNNHEINQHIELAGGGRYCGSDLNFD